uniref:Putative ovule protein n=1 Tax=Solanum chacoense TaxID=4108 RepID=A0A0V0H825_SOLCH
MELLEKSHQVRKKRVSSSKVCLYLRSAVPSSISAKQVILFLFYQYYCSCYYEFAGYSGGQATVVGSVVVTNLTKGIRKGAWERSEVYFHDIPDEIIDSLIEEGIILNVAGGLMLEHPLTLPFVDTLIGTADSVMGLPRSLTEKLIEETL